MTTIIRIGNLVLVPYKHREPMQFFRVELGERNRESQVFSYQRHSDSGAVEGDMLHIAVWPLVMAIRKGWIRAQPRLYDVNAEQAAFVIAHNGIETAHLDRMRRKDVEEPGTILLWPDGKETIIDGNHRYVKRCQLGLETMWFNVVTDEQVQPFLLDLPDELAPPEVQEARSRS